MVYSMQSAVCSLQSAYRRARHSILQSSIEQPEPEQSVAPALSCLSTPHAYPTINGLKMASKRASHSNFMATPMRKLKARGSKQEHEQQEQGTCTLAPLP